MGKARALTPLCGGGWLLLQKGPGEGKAASGGIARFMKATAGPCTLAPRAGLRADSSPFGGILLRRGERAMRARPADVLVR